MSDYNAVIDHAAALQRQVDRLSYEIGVLALATLCLAVAVAVYLWAQEQDR
jgi:hypothetical protein